jgi:hypothetical protein
VLALQRTDSKGSLFLETDRVYCMKWMGGRCLPSFGVTKVRKLRERLVIDSIYYVERFYICSTPSWPIEYTTANIQS